VQFEGNMHVLSISPFASLIKPLVNGFDFRKEDKCKRDLSRAGKSRGSK